MTRLVAPTAELEQQAEDVTHRAKHNFRVKRDFIPGGRCEWVAWSEDPSTGAPLAAHTSGGRVSRRYALLALIKTYATP